MSIPFSNTNYRIPRGFANLLEGLAREVLREQPKDIPQFAAKYFAGLLKRREESGVDPAEWGAALEDRYYNNHSFQQAEDTTYTSLIEGVSGTGEDVSFLDGSVDVQETQDLTSSIPLPEEEPKHVEDTTYTSHIEGVSGTGEDVSFLDGSVDVQQPQDVTSSIPLSEEEPKILYQAEEMTLTSHTEDVSDRSEGVSILDSSVDAPQPQDRPSSAQLSEEEHTGEDTEERLRTQAATVIQAALRGHQTRQEVEKLRADSGEKSIPEYPASDLTSEKASENQDTEQRTEEADPNYGEHLEPHSSDLTDVPKDGPTPEEFHEDNTETSPDISAATAEEELSSRETTQNEGLETPMVETESHKVETGEEREEDTKDRVMEEVVVDDAVGETGDKEKHGLTTETHEPEAAEPPSSSEEPDSRPAQEPPTHEADQNEAIGIQDNETMSGPAERPVLEDTSATAAESMTTGDQPISDHLEDGENPREEKEACRKQPEEALDIALDDPDANAAAAKIQAGFRGHMTRKKMKSGDPKHKEGKDGGAQGEHEGD